MREMKFRFWDSKEKIMHYETSRFAIDCDGEVSELIYNDTSCVEWVGTYYSKHIIPLQCTGLKDSTMWDELSEQGKQDFYDEHCTEDGKTIKYRNVDDVKHLWNGKEIYEGDIVAFTHKKFSDDVTVNPFHDIETYTRNYVVEYVNTYYKIGYRLRNKSIWFMISQSTLNNGNAVVIGNIYKQPELLQESNV